MANQLAPYAQGDDGSTPNGQLAAVAAIGATLATPGGGVSKAKNGANGAHAYSVAFETTIPKLGLGTRPEHFKSANTALESALKNDSNFAQMATNLGISFPANRGTSPVNWTWHHVPDQPGVLQLVPRDQHQWGSPQPSGYPHHSTCPVSLRRRFCSPVWRTLNVLIPALGWRPGRVGDKSDRPLRPSERRYEFVTGEVIGRPERSCSPRIFTATYQCHGHSTADQTEACTYGIVIAQQRGCMAALFLWAGSA